MVRDEEDEVVLLNVGFEEQVRHLRQAVCNGLRALAVQVRLESRRCFRIDDVHDSSALTAAFRKRNAGARSPGPSGVFAADSGFARIARASVSPLGGRSGSGTATEPRHPGARGAPARPPAATIVAVARVVSTGNRQSQRRSSHPTDVRMQPRPSPTKFHEPHIAISNMKSWPMGFRCATPALPSDGPPSALLGSGFCA